MAPAGQEEVRVERERWRLEPEYRRGLFCELAVNKAHFCISVDHQEVSVGGVRVLGRERPRDHGIRLHVKDEACIGAAVFVREQACSEGLFGGVNSDSGKDADSSRRGSTAE